VRHHGEEKEEKENYKKNDINTTHRSQITLIFDNTFPNQKKKIM
jgi:hypothetical protein